MLDSSVFWSNNESKSELTFHCMGNETELFDCKMEPQMPACERFQSAAVICQGNLSLYPCHFHFSTIIYMLHFI